MLELIVWAQRPMVRVEIGMFTGYADYHEQLVPRLGPRGLLAVDNTVWSARVLDEDDTSADTVALRRFNDHVAADARTTNATVPIGDGTTLIARDSS